jgi:hypothetical protein
MGALVESRVTWIRVTPSGAPERLPSGVSIALGAKAVPRLATLGQMNANPETPRVTTLGRVATTVKSASPGRVVTLSVDLDRPVPIETLERRTVRRRATHVRRVATRARGHRGRVAHTRMLLVLELPGRATVGPRRRSVPHEDREPTGASTRRRVIADPVFRLATAPVLVRARSDVLAN